MLTNIRWTKQPFKCLNDSKKRKTGEGKIGGEGVQSFKKKFPANLINIDNFPFTVEPCFTTVSSITKDLCGILNVQLEWGFS